MSGITTQWYGTLSLPASRQSTRSLTPSLHLPPSRQSARTSLSRYSERSSLRSSRSRRAWTKRIEKVLVLAGTRAQADQLHQIIATGSYPDITFRYPNILSASSPDLYSIYKDCCDVIQEEDITSLICAHPGLELIQAALVKTFPKLKGPKFESVFLALHRNYCRENICDGFAVTGKTLDMNDGEDIGSILEDIGSPALLREAFNFDDCYSKKVRNGKFLHKDQDVLHAILYQRREKLEQLLKLHLDTDRYDQCLELCFTLEEYIKPSKLTGTLHLVEACVVDEVVVPWAISDIGLYKQRPVVVRHTSCPSQLDEADKFMVWAVYREVAQALIDHGFNNQFLQLEMFIGRNGVTRILNVIPSLNRHNISLYRHVLLTGDSLLAQVNAGLGQQPVKPRRVPQRCAFRASIASQIYNISLDQVIDLKAAKNTEELTLTHSRPDFLIEQQDADEEGVILGEMKLYGTDYKECFQRMKEICKEVVKEWEHSKVPELSIQEKG